jgi:hypothetical protein
LKEPIDSDSFRLVDRILFPKRELRRRNGGVDIGKRLDHGFEDVKQLRWRGPRLNLRAVFSHDFTPIRLLQIE